VTLNLPKALTPKDLADALVAVEGRLAAMEELVRGQGSMIGEQAVAVADHWALRDEITQRNAAGRLEVLEARSEEAFASVAQNVRALRAIFTLLHPDEEHPEVTNEVIPNGEWLHALVMDWLDIYGGRIPPGETR
jgi:hypothetical protein